MPEPGAAPRKKDDDSRFLTFRIGERLYALPADEVAEVIRTPAMARVPQAPKGLMGIANLRGAAVAVASLRGLLGRDAVVVDSASRAIVLNGATPVAVVVDRVETLVAVPPDAIETRQTELASEDWERVHGAFQPRRDGDVAKVLDMVGLLAAAFVPRARVKLKIDPAARDDLNRGSGESNTDRQALVTFEIADQEYAIDLSMVREIISHPDTLARAPDADSAVLGVATYRDRLLPILSLRVLLGFPPSVATNGRSKVMVTAVSGVLVGLLADGMGSVFDADLSFLEPIPPMLAARTGGEAKVRAIYRGEGGRRLISILSPETLFREDVMQRLAAGEEAMQRPPSAADAVGQMLQFLAFRLGDDEFALPIDSVDEVARVPEQITRVPKAPKFLEGVVNLRGEVIPVVDQRRRFDMPPLKDGAARRLVVVRTETRRAALIVDSVSGMLASAVEALEPAPDLTGEGVRLVSGVINLQSEGRIVLILDPAELLSRTEHSLLDDFDASHRQPKG